MGLFDDVLGPKPTRAGLFDDVLGARAGEGAVQRAPAPTALNYDAPGDAFAAAAQAAGLSGITPNYGIALDAPLAAAQPMAPSSRYGDTGPATLRPDRGVAEALVDAARAAKAGARRTVLGYADLPRQAINTLNTGLNAAASGLAGTFGGDAGPGVPMIQQPGWLAELEANAEMLAERERRMTASAASEFDAANMPDGLVQTLNYIASNPGALLEPAAQSGVSMLLGGAVGRLARSGSVGIAAGAADQASQSARAVEAALIEKGVPPEQAAELAAQAFANAGAIGVLAPRLVPGGRSFEDVIAGTLGRGTGGTAARAAIPLLGEPASEALEEGAIQANQNLYSGEPIGQGVGGAAALGGLLGFGMGAPGAVVEGSRALTESREQRNLRIAQDERAPIEERLAAAIELATAGEPQTADAAPSTAIQPTPMPAPVAPPAAPRPAAPNLGDLDVEDTDDLDALLTRNLPPEIVEAARIALGDLDTEPAPPAAAPPAATLPVTPAAQPTPPQPDTPRAPKSAEPAASTPEPRAPVPATPTPAQAGQAPAEQSAPVSAGADLAAVQPKPARARAVKVDKNRKPMDMLRVIAANGGLNREAFRRTGVDPAEFTRRAGFNYVFRKEGGMTPSDLREFMQQEGYLQRDPEFGRAAVDDNDAVDLFDRAFRGSEEIYSDDQAEAVAEMRRAREAADAEFRGEVASLPEFADFDPFEADPVTAEFTSEIARLTERAYDLGATDEEIVGAAFDSDVAGDRIVALQDMIERLEREQADADKSADASPPEGGAEPRQVSEPEPSLGDFALAPEQPRAQAPRKVAPTQGGGLFGAPTARDLIDGATRARDAQRDGRTATGRTDMAAGDGELFAGPRPAQARVDEAPSKVDAALARWNRSPAGWDFRNAGARERKSFERGFRAGYEGGNFPREAVANRAMDRGWQTGQKFAEIDENAANGMEFTESGELRPIRAEPLESVEDAPFYSAAFRRWADDAPVVTPAMAMDYEFRTGDKVVLAAFHGTKRPDRIGKGFNAKRATSGPMAYFTSAPDVASNYAKGKNDTSLAYEDTEFATWFKVKVKGARNPVAIDRAWWSLEPEDRQRIAALAPRVMLDDDAENVVLGDEGRTSGLGNYEWELKQARGNHLRALVESWLSSGSIYDNEQQFMDVLAKAGMPMDGVTYDSPNAEFPAVFPVHIAMRNPLVSTDIPAEVMGRLRDSAKRDRSRAKNDGADGWDKRTTTLREWVADLEAGNDYVWTRIPDKVTDVLRAAGYDGIIDMGGKGGGPRHRVYVPFAEGQVKSVFNKGRYDESKRDLLETLSDDELTDADLTHAERAAFARQSAAMREQDEDADLQAELARMSREQGAEDADRLGLRAAVEAAVGSSPVTYLRGYDGLPDNLRTSVERRNSMGRHGRTAGLYDPATGTVYLFTDVVSTPERAAFTAAHEIAGHHGLRRLLGDDLDRALELALQNPTVARLADEIASQRKLRPDQRMLAAEESLAELAAAVRTGDYGHIADRYGVEVPTGIRERVKAAIENFLRRLKALFDRKSVAFTDADVRELLENAWQAAAGRATLFPNQPLRSAAPEQTETAAFRRWFGDSKVVDADGKPLVVYHGSHEAWEQMLSPEQRMGRFDDNVRGLPEQYWRQEREVLARSAGAVWFTDSEYVADGYAGQRDGDQVVRPFYLSIRNPLDFRDMDSEEAGRILAEAFGEPVAVGTEYGRDKGIAHAIVRDNSRVVAYARANGYDGLIYPDTDVYGRGVHTSFVALNPGQAKSATANRGTFDPASPSILESVEDAQQRAEQRRNEAAGTLPVSRGTPGWNYDSGVWEGRKGQAKRARMDLQDKMIGWRDVQNQIASQVGAAIPDAANVYRLENLMHGRVSEGIDRIEREQVEPLLDAMRKAGVKLEVLEDYLYALHARERNARIAEMNPAMPDGGSGMTNAQAERILAGADRATLDPLAKRVAAITRANRRRLLENGLITQDAFDAMEAQYEHYVPLRGRPDPDGATGGAGAGRGLDTRSKPVKQALGRRSRARNILGEVIGDAQRSVILAEKARVGRAVMRLVLANPNPDLWTVEPVQTERALDANGEVYDRVVNDWSDPSIVAVRHKGQIYRVQINPPELATALNNVGVDQLGSITRAAAAVNRYFSAILTKYNPAFVPVNATRDALFGLTGLAVEHGEGVALEAALGYLPAAYAATKHAAGKGGSGQWDQWAREFAAAGGKTGYVAMPSVEELQRSVARVSMTGPVAKLTRAAKPIADAVGVLNDGVENALRLSAYVTLRKRGMAADAAAEYAKNMTVNFNRKGVSGTKLNAWFLFYNAATQGAKRTGDLLRRPKTYAYLGALASIQTIAAMAAMGMEDEEGEPLWNKIPDHVKRRNLVIVLPASGEYESKPTIITIPMPYGFNLFTYTAGRTVGEVANRGRGDKSHTSSAAKITADVIGAATESFFPVPINDGALGFVPAPLRILTNVQTNFDDFGRQIRKDDPYAKSDMPRASMGRPDTLELFKLTATGLNRIGGGDELTPPPLSWFDRAPEDLEYLLKEVTGGAGKFVIDTATLGQKITGGEFAQESVPKDRPIINRFVSNIDNEAAQQALFYDRREYVERGLKRVRIAFERDGEEAAVALLAATPELKGADFKRRKKTTDKGEAGDVILVDGRPQIVVADERAVYGRYKAATEAMTARNDSVEESFANVPARLLPNDETRLRDASIRTSNRIRMAAQREFSEAWVRDVVGAAE